MAKKKAPLKQKEIDKKLKSHPEWSVNKNYTNISRTVKLPNFVAALALAAKITVHAEVLDHHPEIEISYGKLKVKITTHEAKGLTSKDFELAKKIDGMKEG